jgi:hypothetical protein
VANRATVWADAHLVPEWRKAHRFISVRSAALQAAILITWATLPDDMKTALPSWLLPCIAGFCLFVGTVGVMVNQKSLVTEKHNDAPKP